MMHNFVGEEPWNTPRRAIFLRRASIVFSKLLQNLGRGGNICDMMVDNTEHRLLSMWNNNNNNNNNKLKLLTHLSNALVMGKWLKT
jgi:hypothetical protein